MIGKLRNVVHGDILGNVAVYPAGAFVEVREDKGLFSIAELMTGTLIRAGDRSLVTAMVDYDIVQEPDNPNSRAVRKARGALIK